MHPPGRARSEIFVARGIWKVGVVNLAVIACVYRQRRRKKVANFIVEKSAPPEKLQATPMGLFMFPCVCVSVCD